MQILESHHREQLEREILGFLIRRKDLFDVFELSLKDFISGFHRGVYAEMLNLKTLGKNISIVNLSVKFKIQEIAWMFDDYYRFDALPDYKDACMRLREDTLRREILKGTELNNNSVDFMAWVDELRGLPSTDHIPSFQQQLDKYKKLQDEIKENAIHGNSVGLLTYWQRFNEKVGAQRGDYLVCGARTSIGKTTFSLNLAVEAAALGQKVLFISLEQPEKQILDKVCAKLTKRPIWKFKYAKAQLGEAMREMSVIQENFNCVFLPRCTSSMVQSIARRERPDVIVVDYLQLLKDESLRGETENNRLGKISGNLKAIAGENNLIMIVPAQLNRDSEKQKREPYLSDLRDSGCIEQDADVVMLLHRKNRSSVDAQLIIAKNRNGSTGKIYFNFNPEWGYFEEDTDILPE